MKVLLSFQLMFVSTALATDQSETKWSGTWDDERWGEGKATLVIVEDFGDSWECIWRDGSGIRYKSVLSVSEEGGKRSFKGSAKGRLRTISLEGTMKDGNLTCHYKGRDCEGTVEMRRE